MDVLLLVFVAVVINHVNDATRRHQCLDALSWHLTALVVLTCWPRVAPRPVGKWVSVVTK